MKMLMHRAALAVALLALHCLVASLILRPSPRTRHAPAQSALCATTARRTAGVDLPQVDDQEVLVTNPVECRMLVRSDRYVVPGDYVLHEDYGVGRYKGQRLVDLTPSRQTRQMQLAVVVQFADAELISFKKMADKEYWVYREGESGEQELSSLVNTKKWKKRKRVAEESCKSMALNLLSMLAIRNGHHRTPCLPLSAQYHEFEKRFPYEPTTDQQACFKAIENDMVMR